MIHTLSLQNFDNNIKSLVKALKGYRKLLASCGESESSILENLLRVQKKYPSSRFISYIERFQVKYYNGTNIDLDDFMRNIVIKYESLVEDGHWKAKSEKYVNILALTSQIQELKILFAKQSTYQDRNKNINVGKKGLKIVATHGKQSLQHLVNLGQKKRTGALGTGANGMNTGLQITTQKNLNATR